MRGWSTAAVVMAVWCAASGAEPVAVRNPFWPIGYEGRREVITAEVRVVPKSPEETRKAEAVKAATDAAARLAEAKKAEEAKRAAEEARRAAEAKAREITDQKWEKAQRTLRFGGRVKVRGADGAQCTSVMINGNTYADGDLVSISFGLHRFTWRVKGVADDNKLTLERVRARLLEQISD